VSLVAGTFRGVRRRAGVSVGILLVATVAAAAAAAGPAYDGAARNSILEDNLHTGTPIERTVEVADGGPVAGLADTLNSQVNSVLAQDLGGQAVVHRFFQPPVEVVLAQVHTGNHLTALTYHTDFCAHLQLTSGSCPQSAGQVLVSTSYARVGNLRLGDAVDSTSGYGRLVITGEYTPPTAEQQQTEPYWLVGPCDDFGYEYSCSGGQNSATAPVRYDAMFTPAGTFAATSASEQGQAWVLDSIQPDNIRAGDLGNLTAAVNELVTDSTLQNMIASTFSSIPQMTAQITDAWRTLDVPVFLITCQVLLLAWLLLFLIATDAAQARAGEVALAKLRGHGRVRTIAFGLSEPVLLLAAAFPAGALAGWAGTAGLTRFLLRPGTHADLTLLAIAAAAAATLGGFVAVVLAARSALVRPVIEQWRHTARGANRGWVLDSVLLTCAVAGLGELIVGGNVTSTRSGSLGLLVPGLLGLAAAVITSRLLPAACQLAFPFTRRRGGTGLFLAVRHIARRPGGTRTTIVLTAAFALATFAVAAFVVDQRNVNRVATAQTGAVAVLNVTPPGAEDLGAIVDRIDPGGSQASAVAHYTPGASNGSTLLAVEPQRFARVAQWQTGFLDRPAEALAAIAPPVAPPVTLPAGSTVRVQVTGESGVPKGAQLVFWLVNRGLSGGGQQPVSFGDIHQGVLSTALTACPCDVTMVTIETPTSVPAPTQGSVTLDSLAVQTGTSWTPVPGALASVDGWGAGAEEPVGCSSTTGQLQADTSGFRWAFSFDGACSPALHRHDTPVPLPAVVASGLGTGLTSVPTVGLDGHQVIVQPIAVAAAIPGAPSAGVLVDRDFALLTANYIYDYAVVQQVWVAPGALDTIRAKLLAAHVTIDSVTTAQDVAALLGRQGPALASPLFLAAAVSAALLAAGAAVLGLYQAGRRRRYEYAALAAGRVPRRALRSSLLIEQAVVLGFGAIAGVAAGIASAALVLRNVPVFLSTPAAPPLLFGPPVAQVFIWFGLAVVLLAVPATLAAMALIRSSGPELLREGPS